MDLVEAVVLHGKIEIKGCCRFFGMAGVGFHLWAAGLSFGPAARTARDDADDVVQEVFTAFSRSVQSWLDQEQRGKFRNWLFGIGITKRIAINSLLRRPIASVGTGGDDAASLLQLIPVKEREFWAQVAPEGN